MDGKALTQLQVMLENLAFQTKKFGLSAEVLLVDWNPPSNSDLLKDALILPKDHSPLTIRTIVVPEEICKLYRGWRSVNINAPTSRNIAIRRARGEFILITNSDVIFSDELIKYLSKKQLKKGVFYRADRYNVEEEILTQPASERIDFCRKNTFEVFKKVAEKDRFGRPLVYTEAAGEFILMARDHWHNIRGWPEIYIYSPFTDGLMCYMAFFSGLKEQILLNPFRVYHMGAGGFGTRGRLVRHNRRRSLWRRLICCIPFRLTQLVKEQWWRIVRLARPLGLLERYETNLPYLSFLYSKALKSMRSGKKSFTYNDECWGFPKENFEEFTI